MNDSKVSKVSCNAGTFVSARAILVSICAALSLIALSACVTKTVAPSTVPMVSFQLLPPATIQSGGQAQLIAVVTNDPKMMGIDWNPSCTTTSCGSFNPTHTVSGQPTTYTAPTSAPQGGVNLAARATALPAQTAVVNVTIFTNVTIKLTGFPASPLGAGNTTSITAVVSGDPNNPPLGVGWSFTCTVSNCGSLSAPQTASGSAVTYTAPASVTTGFTVVIQATPLADTTQIITTSITVNPSSSVQVAFNPGPPGNIPAGTTVMVAATVSNDPQAGGVNWSVTCTNSAAAGQCGTFANPPHTASGVLIAYTAPATVPAGGLPVVITAASADVPSAVANASSNITNPALSVAITTGPPSSMPVSATAPLVATLQNDTSNKGVTWMASCTAGDRKHLRLVQSDRNDQRHGHHVSGTYRCPHRGRSRDDHSYNRCHTRGDSNSYGDDHASKLRFHQLDVVGTNSAVLLGVGRAGEYQCYSDERSRHGTQWRELGGELHAGYWRRLRHI